jgi:hypothetical protein
MIALQHQGLNPADAIRRRRSGLDAEAGRDERPAPLTPSPTASYRFLGSTGMQPVEAGNLTAFSIGLKPVEDGWQVGEIERLLFVSYLVAHGRLLP